MRGSVANSINLSVARNRNVHFYRDKLSVGVQLLRGCHDLLVWTQVRTVGHALISNAHQPSGKFEIARYFPVADNFLCMGVASCAKMVVIVEIYAEIHRLPQCQNACDSIPALDVSR